MEPDSTIYLIDASDDRADDEELQGQNNESQDAPDNANFITEKEELLRQLSAPHPETDSELDHHVKKVTIHYPSSVTMIYNRRTWPLPKIQSLTGDFECGMDALMLDGDDTMPDDELKQIAEQQTATLRRTNNATSANQPSGSLSPARKMRIRTKVSASLCSGADIYP